MQAVTYSEARHGLKNFMDTACSNHEPILITRRKNESVVLLSLEDYESLMESEYLLSSPANATRLMQSIQEARTGKRTHWMLLNYECYSYAYGSGGSALLA